MTGIVERLNAELDSPGLVLSEPSELAAYTTDWTRKYSGAAPAVLRPRDTEDVARCVRACRTLGLALVPQGGNTGLVGGSVPRAGEVVLSLSRLNAIESFDAASATVQVQAGVVLQALHEDLAGRGCVFPVDLGARGSCQFGGMIATNAGGIKVLRYGHMREQVLGLEVVLADGTVLRSLNSLKKNNTGLDLKHVFIGSEGMLGIITRAVLQVRPAPEAVQTALLALDTRERLPELLTMLRQRLRGLSSLEIITRESIALYQEVEPGTREPRRQHHDHDDAAEEYLFHLGDRAHQEPDRHRHHGEKDDGAHHPQRALGCAGKPRHVRLPPSAAAARAGPSRVM